MKYTWRRRSDSRAPGGFSIAEVLIIVVVVAILAAITVVAYNNFQRSASRSSVVSSLRQVSTRIASGKIRDGSVPATLDDLTADNPEVQMVLVGSSAAGSHNYYSNLTEPQNGLLFYGLCGELVEQGHGNGPNDFGTNTIAYISGCHVYDINYMQINGWNGGFNISSPSVTKQMLQNYVDTAANSHSSHPSYRAALQGFMDQLIGSFEMQGGSFPITSFWRPWLSAPVLPPPEEALSGPIEGYCIVATSVRFGDISYVSTSQELTPREGASCS